MIRKLLLPVRGFTLIELLVVVTIIVILIALLAPAMDRAIYQAELAVCGAKTHAIATGALGYTAASRRFYPYRALAQRGQMRPIDIQYYFPTALPSRVDDRPVLRSFLSLNDALNCPLAPKPVDLDNSGDTTNVIANYGLWFGFGFQGEKRLTRLGDRFTWAGDEFNVLAGDWAAPFDGSNETGPHPDQEGSMVPYVYQDQEITTGLSNGPFNFTISLWSTQGAGILGLVDLNYAMTDGSVQRYNRVAWDEGKTDDNNQRLVYLPQWDIPSNQPIAFTQVPRR